MGSKFQRFLWTVAGAELDILEKCRTDHKRYSAIGATILITTFFAFLAGTCAALYFTQSGDESSGSVGWSILFGLIWALLIFCIDRSLVITLKKDPSAKRQKYLIPLLSRMALACVIAYMMSTPLELFIFADFIAEKKYDFNIENKERLSVRTKEINGENDLDKKIDDSNEIMARLDSLNQDLEKVISSLESEIAGEREKLDKPTTSKYKNAKNSSDAYRDQIRTATNNLQYATNADDSTKYENKIKDLKDLRLQHLTTMKSEVKAWNEKINLKIEVLDKKLGVAKNKYDQNASDYEEESDRRDANRDTQRAFADKRSETLEEFEHTTNRGNRFIQNYRILEYAVSERDDDGKLPAELFFLWMIRLIFFIIEMLPTVVKVVTPVGSYDRMVQAEEKQVMAYLESDEYVERIRKMHDIELKTREEQLQKQHQIELELKSDILEKVKNAQIEVADATIAKWKENEMSKVYPQTTEPENI